MKDIVFDIDEYSGEIRNMEPHKHRLVKFMSMDEILGSGRKLADCITEYVKYFGSNN